MSELKPGVVYGVCITCVVLCCAGYLMFLALSWAQMQDDRRVRLAAVETILDKVKPGETDEHAAE